MIKIIVIIILIFLWLGLVYFNDSLNEEGLIFFTALLALVAIAVMVF